MLLYLQVPPELAIQISIAFLSESSDGDRNVDALVTQLTKELVVGSSKYLNIQVTS